MAKQLSEGTRLSEIQYPSLPNGEMFFWRVGDSKGLTNFGEPPTKITVTMENGQMAYVPWALIEFSESASMLVNLAFADTVVFAKETSDHG